MSERLTLALFNAQQGHQALQTVWRDCIKPMLISGHRMTLEVKPETRSSAQNRLLWARLGEIAKHVEWYGQHLAAEEWKHVFTAALKKERVVPGINGGFVVLGQSTSKMTRAEMTDLQTIIEAFASEKGVIFREWVDQDTGEIH